MIKQVETYLGNYILTNAETAVYAFIIKIKNFSLEIKVRKHKSYLTCIEMKYTCFLYSILSHLVDFVFFTNTFH